MKKIIALILTVVLAAAMFAACASSNSSNAPQAAADRAADNTLVAAFASKSDEAADSAGIYATPVEEPMDYDEEADEAYDVPEVAAEAGGYDAVPPSVGGGDDGGIAGPAVTPVVDSRKIIKNVNMQLQTLTFDSGVDAISQAAESFGGYVQDSYIEGLDMYNTRGTRTASFTLRIPSERLDAFVNSLGGQFNVISKSQNSQDITDTYFDSRARLESLKVQEKRLLAMLEDATELEYMLKVETALMDVRYEIESLTSALSRMDGYVSLSTVNITLYEVVKYEPVENVPVTFGERISRAFTHSWTGFVDFSQNFAVAFIVALPFLIVLTLIVIVIVLIRRRSKKRRANRVQTDSRPAAYTSQDMQNAPDEAPAEKPSEFEKE